MNNTNTVNYNNIINATEAIIQNDDIISIKTNINNDTSDNVIIQ